MKSCMTLVKVATVSAAALLLTACVSAQMPISPASDAVKSAPPPPVVAPNGSSDKQAASCEPGTLQSAIGEPFDEANVTRLQSESGARQVRVLRPGDMATMDHRPDRLTIHLDDQGAIEALRCG